MENLGVFIFKSFSLKLTSLKETRQVISRNIRLFLTIVYLEMVSRELLGSTNWARAQVLCIHESTEVMMVSKDENLIFAVF